MKNKKALSDVVTTVLIILFAIVAVAIIGGIIINQIGKTGGKIGSSTVCSEIDITPKACIKITDNAGGINCGKDPVDDTNLIDCAQVKIMRGGAISTEYTIKSITPIFELKDGNTKAGTEIIGLGLPGNLATIDATLTDFVAFAQVAKAGVAVKVVDKKGQEINCDLYKTTKVDCLETA